MLLNKLYRVTELSRMSLKSEWRELNTYVKYNNTLSEDYFTYCGIQNMYIAIYLDAYKQYLPNYQRHTTLSKMLMIFIL